MRRIAIAATILAAILASPPGVLASDVAVTGAFARASASSRATTAAAYFTVTNRGVAPDRLIAIAAEGAAMAQIHESRSKNGIAAMEMLAAIELAPSATVAMKPGGLHVMLMGLAAPLRKGDTLALELTFEKAGRLTVAVPVRGVAATGP
jgi:hypothetical protein